MRGCNGACCEKFTLPLSLKEIEKDAKSGRVWNGDPSEILKIQAMVIPLKSDSSFHYYTCKYFDVKTRKCLNYENRPVVCRQHPLNKPCPYPGCTEPINQGEH